MRELTQMLEREELIPPVDERASNDKTELAELKKRTKAALKLHRHEADGGWIMCDGREYSASKGCPTARILRGVEHG